MVRVQTKREPVAQLPFFQAEKSRAYSAASGSATGLTDTSMPILMFCVAFGLSMDYEVFLLSRMKEEYDRTGDNDLAVATGLERTGRLVTAAALLLSITFFAFATHCWTAAGVRSFSARINAALRYSGSA